MSSGLSNEAGYIFRDRHPERTQVYERFDAASAAARRELGCRCDVAYGSHPRMRFDLFPGREAAPLVVFFHGGYWQSLDKLRYSFVAAALVPLGFAVALPTYPLAREVSLRAIVGATSACLPAIFASLGRLPPFWIASGHSAGGHLAAMLAAATDADPVPIAGCVPVSGIFDLVPIVQTSLNAALGLDAAQARALSPVRRPPPRCAVTAFVGAEETDDFIGQSRDFVDRCVAAGERAEMVSLPGRNHYTVLCDLLEDRSRIAGAIEAAAGAYCQERKTD